MNIYNYLRSLGALSLCIALIFNHNYAFSHSGGVIMSNVDSKMLFTENKGQWPSEAKFSVGINLGTAFFTNNGIVYNLTHPEDLATITHANCGPNNDQSILNNLRVRSHAYKVVFKGANTNSQTKSIGVDKQKRYVNYFIGNDRSKWASNVGVFTSAYFKDVYSGIDVKYYGAENGNLKYDFIVKSGGNPSQIKLGFEGNATPTINANGDLVIKTSIGDFVEKSPYSYQMINGEAVEVISKYKLVNKEIVFEFPNGYNSNYDLVIDPELVFATYSASVGSGSGMYSGTTTYDIYGNMYAGAKCWNSGWPTTLGAFITNFQGGSYDVGINKYNAYGTAIIYSTYIGGSGADIPYTLRVNGQDELVVGGSTTSVNFPMAINPYQSNLADTRDMFLIKLSQDGTQMMGSTFLGTNSSELGFMSFNSTSVSAFSETQLEPCAFDIAFDALDNMWLVSSTNSTTWPTTSNAFQLQNAGGWDGVIMKFNPDFSALLYSSYIGGSGNDVLYGLDVFDNGNLVVCGATASANLPTTSGVVQPNSPGGTSNGFVAVINEVSGALTALTYIGTNATEQVTHIKVDNDQNVVILGRTTSTNYPITPGAYTNALTSTNKLFVQRLNSALTSTINSTVIKCSTGQFFPSAFVVDMCGNSYIAALKVGPNMPLTLDAFQTGQDDFWMGALNKTFDELIFGSYFGSTSAEDHTHVGVNRFDPQGIVYHSICASATTWPTTSGAVGQTRTFSGGQDIISFKFNFDKSGVSSVFEPNRSTTPMDSFCAPHTVNFVNNSTSAKEFIWDFGDGSPTTTLRAPSHTYTQPGIYRVTLISINDSMCITHDTSYMTVHVYEVQEPKLYVKDTILCVATDSLLISVDVLNPSTGVPGNLFQWTSPSAGAVYGAGNTQSVWVNPRLGSSYTVTVLDSAAGVCTKSSNITLNVTMKPRILDIVTPDTAVCEGDVVNIRARGSEGYTYKWRPNIGVSDSVALEPTITINRSQLYMVTASYPFCIDTSDFINIVMHEYPEVSVIAPAEACEGTEVELKSNVTPYRNDYVYTWTPDEIYYNSTLPNVSFIMDNETRAYWLKVSTPIGCSDSVASVIVAHPKGFGDAVSGVDYCPPGSAQLWASNGVSYEWDPKTYLDDPYSATPITNVPVPTYYKVYITDEHTCVDTLKVLVDVHPRAVLSLPKEVTIYEGGSGYQVTPETNALHFEWFPHAGVSNVNISDPVLNPSVRTRYFVTAKTEFGCTTVDSMDVLVGEPALQMPNAFNPNNPEAPYFKPVIDGVWDLRSFKIFNRWGVLLYETDKINEGWDGKYNDEAQPIGVYIWSIDAVSKDGVNITRTGNVTLIR